MPMSARPSDEAPSVHRNEMSPRPLNIAIVYDVIFPYVVGGVQVRNWEIARRLAGKGHTVTLLGMKHWEGADTIVRDGVRLHGICPPHPLYTGGRRAIWPPIHFGWHTFFSLRHADFDIIDVANFPYFPCIAAKLAADVRKHNLVITWIEVWGDYWYEYLGKAGVAGKLLERLCASYPNPTTAISRATMTALKQIGHRGQTTVIPCGVDITAINRVPPAESTCDLLFVGRLIKEKHADLLVRAVARLRAALPDIQCTIVGDGPEKAALADLVDRLGLANHVTLRGFVDDHSDIFALMKSASILVMPSSREGFGITAIEANACGTPVITTRCPRNAAADMIHDGVNGIVCQPTEDDLAAAIARLLPRAAGMRAACLAEAAHYDWDAITGSVEAVYYEALQARR